MSRSDIKNKNAVIKEPMSKVSRLLAHVEYEECSIPNVKSMFKSGLKTGDYHDNMNSVNYVK